jgi:hypothetical protein
MAVSAPAPPQSVRVQPFKPSDALDVPQRFESLEYKVSELFSRQSELKGQISELKEEFLEEAKYRREKDTKEAKYNEIQRKNDQELVRLEIEKIVSEKFGISLFVSIFAVVTPYVLLILSGKVK